jgi:polysaccharide pyruvyl transferase WcaK-like protein
MGDAAMLLTTRGMLKEAVPDVKVTALVSHPEFTRERCPGIDAKLCGWLWPVPEAGKAGFLDLCWYPFILLSNFVSVIAHRLLKARIFTINKRFAGALSSYFDCDVVISPGGDFISPNYFFVTTFSEFLMAKILGKKLVIIGQTMGPFKGLLNGRLAALVLNLADLIIVREHATARQLEGIGVRGHRVTTDLAFAFPENVKRGKGDKRRVIICPKKIGGPSKRALYAEQLGKLAGRIIEEFGSEVVFLPTDLHDVDFQREISSKIDGKVKHIEEVHPPGRIAEIISDADFIVSSRMHAIILGSLSSTPFFAVGDSFKFSEILDSLCEGCAMGIEELDDKGIERIIERIREREKLRGMIADRMAHVGERARESSSILGEKLREWQK